MRKRLHKKGFLDEIVDDLYAGTFLFLAFLIAFLAFTIGQKDSLVEYKTTIWETYNERTLNLYFKNPIGDDTQLVDFMNHEEATAMTVPVMAKTYFNDYFGSFNWWVLAIDFPDKEREDITVKSSAVNSGQRTAATLTLPSKKGLIQVILFEDKTRDIVLMTTGNPIAALYYWVFG